MSYLRQVFWASALIVAGNMSQGAGEPLSFASIAALGASPVADQHFAQKRSAPAAIEASPELPG